jgi:hypothetical protein
MVLRLKLAEITTVEPSGGIRRPLGPDQGYESIPILRPYVTTEALRWLAITSGSTRDRRRMPGPRQMLGLIAAQAAASYP